MTRVLVTRVLVTRVLVTQAFVTLASVTRASLLGRAGVVAALWCITGITGIAGVADIAGAQERQVPDSARDSVAASAPRVGPPIRRIATASAVSPESFGAIQDVIETIDGRVLVNDPVRRRLLLVDTTLRVTAVVLDSMSETENTYGTRPGALLSWRGDSSVFIDPVSLALLVLDPTGHVARVRSVPRVQDVNLYTSRGGFWGRTSTDAHGRIVYRQPARPARPLRPPPRGVPFIPEEPDSAFIVGIHVDTRKIDTLGVIRIPKTDYTVRVSPTGGWDVNSSTNPLPLSDDWAVLADGRVAFVRGIDYRVEYLNVDGTWTVSPKLPYEWQPISEDRKKQIVDSVKAEQTRGAMTSYTTALIRWVNQYGKKKYPEGFAAPDGYRLPQGFSRDWVLPAAVTFPANYIYACASGEEPTLGTGDSTGAEPEGRPFERAGEGQGRGVAGVQRPAAGGAARGQGAPTGGGRPGQGPPGGGVPPGQPGGRAAAAGRAAQRDSGGAQGDALPGPQGLAGGRPSCIPAPIPNTAQSPPPPRLREQGVIAPQSLPDYRPPFNAPAVRADADGNLWIRTNQPRPVAGGPVFDVVSRNGELVDRIQIPQNYQLAGFGKGRVVYLAVRDRGGVRLARVILR